MNKKSIYISYGLLLIWFTLDMIGVSINGYILVGRSFGEDWIFFVGAIISFILFIVKEDIGKWILLGWLVGWAVTQFIFHEFYTIAGNGKNKIAYFKDTIKLISSDIRYFPDLYHVVLHILIIVSLVVVIKYIKSIRQQTNNN